MVEQPMIDCGGPELVRRRLGYVAQRLPVAARTPLLLLDLDALAERVRCWRTHLRDVRPFYAIKANSHMAVLRHLRDLGVGFDAATRGELDLLRAAGVDGDRIVNTHPIRDAADLLGVVRDRPRAVVVQSESEVDKLVASGVPADDYAPALLVRLGLPFSNLDKFGLRVLAPATRAGRATWRIDPEPLLALFAHARCLAGARGVRFGAFGLAGHVGTNCHCAEHYRVLLALFRMLHARLRAAGVPLELFDLGGGFCDYATAVAHGTTQERLLEEIGVAVAAAAAACAGVEFVAEPGRFLVADTAALVTAVKSVERRQWRQDARGPLLELEHLEVHIDDGIYGTLMGQAHDDKVWELVRVGDGDRPRPRLPAHVWGATCDSYDRLHGLRELPADLAPSDRLLVPGAGAYTIATKTRFNQVAPTWLLAFASSDAGQVEGTLFDEAEQVVWRGRLGGDAW